MPGKVVRFNPAFGAAQARSRHASYSGAGPRQPQTSATPRKAHGDPVRGPRLPQPTPPARAPRGLSRHEARHSRCLSAIPLMQTGNIAMTQLSNGQIVTDLDATEDNTTLTAQGYSIRHIETWHDHDDATCITWDAPQLTDADCPF